MESRIALTNGAGVERWLELTKGWRIYPLVPDMQATNVTEGISSGQLTGKEHSVSPGFKVPEDASDIQAGLNTQELYKKHGRSAFVPLKAYSERRKRRSV